MAKTLQLRRDSTANLAAVTGAEGEIFIDTTKDTVVVMDGSTAGGFPLQPELVSGTTIKTVNGTSLLGSGNITISGGGSIENVTSNSQGIFFDAVSATSSTFTLVSGFPNDYMSGSSATWNGNNVMITGTSSNPASAAQLLTLVVGDTLLVDVGSGPVTLTLSSVFSVQEGMFASYTATVVENSASMAFFSDNIVATHSATTTTTPLIINSTGANISIGTIGDIYYADNILSPIPVISTTSYGTVTTVPPLVVNGPLSVLSQSVIATTFATLAGDNLSGSQSGGTNNFGQISGGTYLEGNRGRVNFSIIKPTADTITFFKNLRKGDILTGIGTNGLFTGSFEMTIKGIQYGPRLDLGSQFVDIGEYGFVQLWGEVTDINNAPNGSSQNINANILTAARPYTTSTVNGGLSPTFLDTQQVVSEEVVVDKKLNVVGSAYIGATHKRSSGIFNQYASGVGAVNVSADVRTKDFMYVSVSGATNNAIQLQWTMLDPKVEAYERTITIMMTASSTTPLTVANGGATTRVDTIDPLVSYSTAYDIPTYWKDNSYPVEVVGGRTLEMKFKFVASGGSFVGLYGEWKQYY